ncbi:MAG: glycosyl hydrolase [Tepidisphaeraceae bacterium]
MSLTDQLQTVLASANELEQQLQNEAAARAQLSQQIQTLTTANADLARQLAALQGVGTPPAPVAAMEWGFVASDADAPAALLAGLTRAKADGAGWVRLWHSHFGALSANNVAAITAAAARGIRVILCLQPKDGESRMLGTPDIAGFVSKNRAMLAKVDFVEAGNELNLAQYRPDDLGGPLSWQKPYVDRWLSPLRTALAAINVKTLCTSITDTYHPDTYAQQYDLLQAAGAVDASDGVAVHVYVLPQYLQSLANIFAHLKQTWAKPIWVTECNVQTKGLTPAEWQAQFHPYVAALRDAGAAGVMFYRGIPKTNGTWTWPTLFDAAGNVSDQYASFLATVKRP